MIGFVKNLHDVCQENTNFRTVIWTGKYSQLVVQSVQPGEDIGIEIHPTYDQIIYFQDGPAKVILSKKDLNTTHEGAEEHEVSTGWTMVIPHHTYHNIINTGTTPLQIYTTYAPPKHKPNTVHRTKADALTDPAEETFRFLSDL